MAHFDDQAIQGANTRYIRAAMNTPMLERDDEFALARRWKEQKDEKALHALVRPYARLAVSIAAKFRNYGLPMGDLIQEGNIGLMEAAMRFDPALENRFSTYATWWIRAQIQDYVLRNWSIVRTGTTAAQKTLFFNLRRLRARIQGRAQAREWMDDDSLKTIAGELGVSQREVAEMEARLNGGDHSLNNPVGAESDGPTWQDIMADPSPSPEDIVIARRDGQAQARWLHAALSTLSPRERSIIRQRKMQDRAATLEDLGKALGISKERVRQIEQGALLKLRAAAGPEPGTMIS